MSEDNYDVEEAIRKASQELGGSSGVEMAERAAGAALAAALVFDSYVDGSNWYRHELLEAIVVNAQNLEWGRLMGIPREQWD